MPLAAESTVATALASAGLSLTLGSNMWLGPRDEARRGAHIWVACYAGDPPQPVCHQSGSTPTAIYAAAVQVHVQSDPGVFATAQTLARGIYSALAFVVLAGTIAVSPEQSAPLYLGPDQYGAHHWTINFTVRYTE